jgi:hypothetical protein
MILEDAVFFGLVDAFFLYGRRLVQNSRGHRSHHVIYLIDEASAYAAAVVK